MKTKLWMVFVLSAVIGLSCAAGFFYYQHQLAEHAKAEAAQKEAEEQAQQAALQKKDQETKAHFEDFLNGFLKDIHDGAQIYKQERMVLDNLVKPENFKTPAYLKENTAFLDTTATELQAKMDKVMVVFEKADEALIPLLKELSDTERPVVEKKWKDIREKQAALFMGYFASEQDIITAYQALMHFYVSKIQSLQIAAETGEITFESEADTKTAQDLKDKIDALTQAQAELFQQ